MYSYDIDGIEIVKGALTTDAIETLSRKTRALLNDQDLIQESITVQSIARQKPQKIKITIPESEPLHAFIVNDLISLDKDFAKYFMDSAILNHVAEKLVTSVNEVVYHFSNITSKPAKYGPEISVHRDFPNRYFCPTDSNFMRVLIPLDRMSQSNGGLYFVQSSHMITDRHAVQKIDGEADYAARRTLFIDAIPGDLVLLNSKTLHGSQANISDVTRCVLVVQYGLRDQELSVTANEYMSLCTKNEMDQLTRIESGHDL